MPLSPRQQAANLFRAQMRRSNELHTKYLADPQLQANYDRFANWQLDHLLPFFADLYEQPGYAEAIDFTMNDLAGVGISSRDRDLERAAPAVTRMLPLGALKTIASAAEMNARVLESNIAIYHALLVGNKLPDLITEIDYCIACRKASSLEELVELVHLITGLGRTLKSLIHIPMIGMTLRAMRAPAHCRTSWNAAIQRSSRSRTSIFFSARSKSAWSRCLRKYIPRLSKNCASDNGVPAYDRLAAANKN